MKFLKGAGVLLLLSPPHTPRYNGAVECGIFPIKNFGYLEAARNDRPAAMCMEDVFAGKCRYNAAACPERSRGVRPEDPFDSLRSLRAGPLGRTPQEIFDIAIVKALLEPLW